MSEKEIIETLTNYNLVNHFNNTKFFEALKCLLNMYNQEKENNKEYEEALTEWVNGERIYHNHISKDKIRAKIEEYKHKDFIKLQVCYTHDDIAIKIAEVLEELLEE